MIEAMGLRWDDHDEHWHVTGATWLFNFVIVQESNVERLARLSACDVCSFPISPHVRYLRSRPSHQRELLASKVLEIGKVPSNRWRPRRGEET
jgi:hypothetical protein